MRRRTRLYGFAAITTGVTCVSLWGRDTVRDTTMLIILISLHNPGRAASRVVSLSHETPIQRSRRRLLALVQLP
jgi:hypothetical protein